jgi:hypothetical protein
MLSGYILTVSKHRRVIDSHGVGNWHWKAIATIDAMLQKETKAVKPAIAFWCMR